MNLEYFYGLMLLSLSALYFCINQQKSTFYSKYESHNPIPLGPYSQAGLAGRTVCLSDQSRMTNESLKSKVTQIYGSYFVYGSYFDRDYAPARVMVQVAMITIKKNNHRL